MLQTMSRSSEEVYDLFVKVARPMFSPQPSTLGYPSRKSQSSYYPGPLQISRDEVALVSRAMEDNGILPENTRVRKIKAEEGQTVYEILQASVETDAESRIVEAPGLDGSLRIIRGDHAHELNEICSCFREASQYAANSRQKTFIEQYESTFRTGNLHTYKESQMTWIKDSKPSVENIFGFVEPYRDPHGIRAEFEGLVAIQDQKETKVLTKVVEESSEFIRRLPWAEGHAENNGKGPFEKALFDPPDFTSIHTLAYCSSIIFPGINLPNDNGIRQDHGFKNVIIANRMMAESNEPASPFVDPSEALFYQKYRFVTYYVWVVLHELVGHGTGKLLSEEGGTLNFDIENLPINPLTKGPIDKWYRQGQTWTGMFGDLATSVDECRAELVGAYLMDDPRLLALFDVTSTTELKPDDVAYNIYLQIGLDGLKGLQNFNVESGSWGQAHSRAHFAMLKCLLTNGDGVMAIECDSVKNSLTAKVDRSRVLTHGRPALGKMLLKLHIYRCTADVDQCRAYYESLSNVDGQYLEWRRIVLAHQTPRPLFVQANTWVEGEAVMLKEYEATSKGIIQSWAERNIE